MAWIAAGALVAGTPPDRLPRVADSEMPGEQVILGGFHMDLFPYPNEEGAIPLTSVTQAEARGLCVARGKRLCTELEWERACKGPENHTYEYGDRYSSERCGTGGPAGMRPSGFLVGCRSDFGVRDLHGGAWEWTDSAWRRGDSGKLVTTRGGNAPDGELVGRCANGQGRLQDAKASSVGFRCCLGERNASEVTLEVRVAQKLSRWPPEAAVVSQVLAQLPQGARDDLGASAKLGIERAWAWHPVGNEEIIVMGGCVARGKERACGVVVFRKMSSRSQVLAWVSSGNWMPSLHIGRDPRDVWLLGGDPLGTFKRLIAYVSGSISVGPKERHVGTGRAKKKRAKR